MHRLLWPLLLFALPMHAQTDWYVRHDGGTLYDAATNPSGTCNGRANAPMAGNAPNQSCAVGELEYLWDNGVYRTTGYTSADWVITGGDRVHIEGCANNGSSTDHSCRIGWRNASDSYDNASARRWGIQGDPGSSIMPPPPNGTAANWTQILGINNGTCRDDSAKAQLHGGFGSGVVASLAGASYVTLGCLDITDWSSCGKASQNNGCNTSAGSLSDFADTGIYFNATSHVRVTDVRVHGLAKNGIQGWTLDDVVLDYIAIVGNASAGWNADLSDGKTGSGNLAVKHFNISWNGFAEEYPIVDALPYQDGTDDSSGGYGDGFGTATISSSPAWNVTFDTGVVSYNTQDGLDALHVNGSGSSMTILNTLAYGNMGQQTKIGGAVAVQENNVLVTNCNALRFAIPGTPSGYNTRLSDFCRASDGGIKITVDDAYTTKFDFNTVIAANASGIDIECNATCSAATTIDFRNNLLVGFTNNAANGYPSGGTGNQSNLIDDETGHNVFAAAGTAFTNNIAFNTRRSDLCTTAAGSSYRCVDPLLSDESWHNYGHGDMSLAAGSPSIATGVTIGAITTDYNGTARSSPPSIGAMEYASSATAAVAPSITAQPASVTASAGSAATFTSAANGSPSPAVQWYRDGAIISGATNATYSTGVLTTADSGSSFYAVWTNSAGSATSNPATLTVTAPAPVITAQPVSQTLNTLGKATFSVTAMNATTYQWYRTVRGSRTAIQGATGASYTTPVATPLDSGTVFTVVVSGPGGPPVTSVPATLTVTVLGI